MNEVKNVQVLGVLGGMGPMAGATFASRMVALTPAARDQDHIPLVLCNDPRVPDRSSARLGQGEDPLPAMVAGLRLLERAGATLIAIPCNTAHLWYDQLAAATSLPVLHIVESVRDDLERLGVAGCRVGLMGTAATLQLDLYGEPLRRHGFPVLPTEPEEVRLCAEAIDAVKANDAERGFAPAAACIRRLVARGARAVVLGCTELPLAVPHASRGEFGAVLTDSIDALARTAIRRCHTPMERQA
ncbi:aspartate/glutamate racemase family protein [Ramlibacter sp. RBP-2]|uniref:Aspartate/glutamate racemase family protein n=1 Tax=Ramlibacter lithotrophicus TaxID=2606681 RepID=A0A7X6DCU3_9BURK|nr:amino acid racemase [Ramlibacter lithotrophicus]NKE64829.1 aspartate/glutamate racemase family protein [Ramlibacter lithotrophicus]